MRLPVRLLVLVVAATALLFGPSARAVAATVLVDDDRIDCPSASQTSIAAAVAVAAAGDTVAVCAGEYREGPGGQGDGNGSNAVSVTKDLSIVGVGAGRVSIAPNAAGGPTGAPSIAAVDPSGRARDGVGAVISAVGVRLDLSGVTIRGGGVFAEAGVSFVNASGSLRGVRVVDLLAPEPYTNTGDTGWGVVVASDRPSGRFDVAIDATTVSGYDQGGVLVDSAAPGGGRSGSSAAVALSRSRVEGVGRQNGQDQVGVDVRSGASLSMSESTVTGNVFSSDLAAGPGVRFVDADVAGSLLDASDVVGNGWGVENREASGAPADARSLAATGMWWGDPQGPSYTAADPTLSRDEGERVDAPPAVVVDPFRTSPSAGGPPPAPPDDELGGGVGGGAGGGSAAQPTVALTAPGPGATVPRGVPVAVTATASDDFAVARVEFRRNGQTFASDETAPYDTSLVFSDADAGTVQQVQAVAVDADGLSASDERVIIVEPLAPPPAEDRAPTVDLVSPAAGATLVPGVRTALGVAASDDRGIGGVSFRVDDRQVCADSVAPYGCAFTPGVSDVGARTVSATVTDTAGQTTTALRSVVVRKATATSFRITVTPGRDRRAPYRFVVVGRLSLPAAIPRERGCRGAVAVGFATLRGGTAIPSRQTPLKSDCSLRRVVKFPFRRPFGTTGRGYVVARFAGNDVVAAIRATRRPVRVR